MRKTLWLFAALALAATMALAGCGGEEEEAAGGGEVTVELGEQNDSGQSGTATLTVAGEGMTKVVIELSNPPAEPQPVHIHPGSCADLNPQPDYPLANVEGGGSETTVQASLEELKDKAYAINIHKSEAEVETYVACGDIGGTGGGEEGGEYRY